MPSSSLFLGSCTTLVLVLSLFFVPILAQQSPVYQLTDTYSGDSFFDRWNFFTDADPTHGFVTYVNRSTALSSGLIGVTNGDAFMRVDSTHKYDPNSPYQGNNGYGRPSVRITTQQEYLHGLFIADIKHMPSGCGTWPAYWTLGADGSWPTYGEIDIIEGINNRANNVASLHTGAQCKIAGDPRNMTGTLETNDCYYNVQTGEGATGCGVLDNDSQSYGAGLNTAGGSVVAMEWSSDAIKIWSFPPGSVPQDVLDGNPDPSQPGWGLPAQVFNGPDCVLDNAIGWQNLIFDTTFCGDFVDTFWQSEGCAAQTGYDTCAAYVANNPTAFADVYWQIGSLKLYSKTSATATTTSTETTPTMSTTVVSSTTSTSTETTPTMSTTIASSTIEGFPIISTTIASSTTTTTLRTLRLISETSVISSSSATSESSTTTVDVVFSPIFTAVTTVLDSPTVTTFVSFDSTGVPTTVVQTISSVTSIIILTLSSGYPYSVVQSVSPILTPIVGSDSTGPPGTVIESVSPILVFTTGLAETPTIVGPISPTFTSGWENVVQPTNVVSGVPEGRFYLPPMGAGVAVTSGWEAPRQSGWQAVKPTSAVPIGPETWVDVPSHETTITLTKTWVVPCETGYETKTTHITTKHCGCTETPTPTVPMTVIVTTCPEEWGFKTPLTITVPVTAPTGNNRPVKPTKAEETWATLAPNGKKPEETWAPVLSAGKKPGETWGPVPPAGKTNDETWVVVPSATKNTGNEAEWSTYKPVAGASTWATIAVPASAATPSPSQVWSNVNTPQTPKITKWQGAASKTSIGAGVLGFAIAVFAFIL